MGRSTDKKPFAAQSLTEQVRRLWGSTIGKVFVIALPVILIGGNIAVLVLTREPPYEPQSSLRELGIGVCPANRSNAGAQYRLEFGVSPKVQLETHCGGVVDSGDEDAYWTVTCPGKYAKAGKTYEYDPGEILGSFSTVFSDDHEERAKARDKAIKEYCGGQVSIGVCPSDREGAGFEYALPELDSWKTQQQIEDTYCGLTQEQLDAGSDPTPGCRRTWEKSTNPVCADYGERWADQ